LQESHYSYVGDGIFKADVWPIAYEVAKAGVLKFSNDFNLLDRAAMLAERLGKFDEAEVYRARQLEIDPRHPKVMLYLARDLMEQKKLTEANILTRKSYEFDSLLDDSGRDYRKNLEDELKVRSN
jgi:tetratricopeptide (TPR) repeat protein